MNLFPSHDHGGDWRDVVISESKVQKAIREAGVLQTLENDDAEKQIQMLEKEDQYRQKTGVVEDFEKEDIEFPQNEGGGITEDE